MNLSALSKPARRTLEQLWGPALQSGSHRLSSAASSTYDWRTVRTLRITPRPPHARMFIESAPRDATLASLNAYSGLRRPRARAARAATAGLVALPSWIHHFPTVELQVRQRSGETEADPLSAAQAGMASASFCHIGVRTGGNSKPTAQIFDPTGNPVGYAKFAWNERTARDVRSETRRMRNLAGRSGSFRTPSLLHAGSSWDRPFLVTEPLPGGVQQLHHAHDLTLLELCSLAPGSRVDAPSSSGALKQLQARAAAMIANPLVEAQARALLSLVNTVRSLGTRIPIASYDHGDLVPWNTCRDERGFPWVWDWESSMDDMPAGTDSIHWFVHSVHGPNPVDLVAAVRDGQARSGPSFTALGLSQKATHIATATYIAATVERACTLAASNDTWEFNRVGTATVAALLDAGHHSTAVGS